VNPNANISWNTTLSGLFDGNTFFDAYYTVVRYVNYRHLNSVESRWESLLRGTGNKLINEALTLALESCE